MKRKFSIYPTMTWTQKNAARVML